MLILAYRWALTCMSVSFSRQNSESTKILCDHIKKIVIWLNKVE
jgi:hypothetical protein